MTMTGLPLHVCLFACVALVLGQPVGALNGGRSMIETTNGWKTIEIITEGDRVPSDSSWRIPNLMDGMGAFLVDGGATLRIQVNHERDGDATISEININKGRLKDVISRKIRNQSTGGISFVESSRRAFDKWTRDGHLMNSDDMSWRISSSFCRFCSSQSYEANTFGSNRGFVDRLYITGEECSDGRLFALLAATREMYQLSGVTGSWNDGSGNGGMPFDSFENAALIDTGDTRHVALLLSADGGTKTLKLYIGKRGYDSDGHQVGNDNFLARNGLLYGEWYYLGNLSGGSQTWSGGFVKNQSNAIKADKFEDIDTNPNNPKQAVLAESTSGVYILDFELLIDDEQGFDKQASRFTMRQVTDFDTRTYQYPDNVDWTRNNLIFVNKDTGDGGIWYMSPNGDGKTQVGRTATNAESAGILDLSQLLDYPPATVMITTNQGSPSSMTLLLSPRLKEVIDAKAPSQDCPSGSSPDHYVFQAEDALFVDAEIFTKEAGYCGSGYVDFGTMSELAGISFEIEVPTSGRYKINVRYANGSPASRPALMVVDENEVGDLDFPTTYSWSSWKDENTALMLNEGRHFVELWWDNNVKRPNIDLIVIELLEED